MMTYISQPVFWISVLVVAVVLNWAYVKFFGGKGKLV